MEVSGFTLEPSALNDWVGRLSGSPLMQGLRLATVKVQSTAVASANAPVAGSFPAAAGREAWSFNLVRCATPACRYASCGRQAMKAWWAVQAGRINALSLRERLFLFLSLLVVILAVADVLWLTPAQTAYKQTQQRFLSQSAEVNRLRAELAAVSKPVDGSADLRTEVAQSQARIEALRAEIAAIAPGTSAGSEALEQVLVQFLKRSPGLRLVSSGTVPAEAGADDATSTRNPAPGSGTRGRRSVCRPDALCSEPGAGAAPLALGKYATGCR